jgi:hypothetical protein
MKIDSKFDLEQNILDAWHVVDDISTVYGRIDTLSQDEIMNLLLGLKTLYQIKFEKLFESFESYSSNLDSEKQNKSTMSTLDETLCEPDPLFDQVIM